MKIAIALMFIACAAPVLAQQPIPDQIESQAFVASMQRRLSQAQTEAAQMEAVATRLAARVRELEAMECKAKPSAPAKHPD